MAGAQKMESSTVHTGKAGKSHRAPAVLRSLTTTMKQSIFTVLLSFLVFNQFLSHGDVGIVEAFVAPRSSTAKYVTRRTPYPLRVSPSETSAGDVFLLTTGLKGILPQMPQFNQLFGEFNLISILWGAVAIYSGVFFLVLIGFIILMAPVTECLQPIRDYIDKQDESRREMLGEFLESLFVDSAKRDVSILDSSYDVLSAKLPSLDEQEYGEFLNILVEQFVKAEKALILRVFEYNLFQYFDESEDIREIIWHTSSVELSEKLEAIMQQDFPAIWQELDEEFLRKTEDQWRPLAFLKCLFVMEKDEDQKNIVQQLFTKTPYEDFLDYAWESIRRDNKTENKPSTAV